ncbi:exodeoxyribonuclease VII large subunit [Putridiphycobacter roseus]|uniref:exodeoxyribonuclease VII large subunit n=1 Tax=Putridiphycobacter roseus TaxID=2219161 RepID=UPI0021D375CB
MFTLTQLTTSLENFVLKHFGSVNYWVVAEIAKANEKNGHHYLELVDTVDNRTSALMTATIWAGTYKNIRANIGNDVAEILKPGNKVLFSMRIEFHKVYGLKLNVVDVDPAYSYGEVERRKQATIERLKTEGLFDLQKALYLPVIAKRIALIGSPGTAGHRDFRSKLESNAIYTNFTIKEFATSVQGDKAAKELIEALKEAQTYDVDAIVILRGGGSKMDLNVFNDYELSKHICLSKIPVITGIGHEHDEVVSDLVCRKMCITPTAAAEFLYIQIGTFSAQLRQGFDAVLNHSREMVAGLKDEFNYLQKYLIHHSNQLLLEYQWELNAEAHKIQKNFIQLVQSEKSDLDLKLDKVKSQSIHKIQISLSSDLPNQLERLKLGSENVLSQRSTQLNGLNDLLKMLDPERLLDVGYSISTIDGVDVSEMTGDLLGKTMQTTTSLGVLTSEIKTIKKD